jgi:hypothetical protein
MEDLLPQWPVTPPCSSPAPPIPTDPPQEQGEYPPRTSGDLAHFITVCVYVCSPYTQTCGGEFVWASQSLMRVSQSLRCALNSISLFCGSTWRVSDASHRSGKEAVPQSTGECLIVLNPSPDDSISNSAWAGCVASRIMLLPSLFRRSA